LFGTHTATLISHALIEKDIETPAKWGHLARMDTRKWCRKTVEWTPIDRKGARGRPKMEGQHRGRGGGEGHGCMWQKLPSLEKFVAATCWQWRDKLK